jgi:P27 family predicted phage terminase small subunit
MPGEQGGRPRTPTALKVLRGETRRARLPKDEPKPKTGDLRMPEGMTALAQGFWKGALEEFGQSGVLFPADGSELRLWAEAMARYVKAAEQLETTGPLIRGARRGDLNKNPLHQIVRDNAVLAHNLARSLGLNPSGRASLTVGGLAQPNPPPGPRLVEDPIADLLNPRRLAAKRIASQRRRVVPA